MPPPHNPKNMQTINCGLELNEYHTGVGEGITPAEVLVLTAIHSPGVDRGVFPVIIDPVLSADAITIEQPAQPAEEAAVLNNGKKIPAKDAVEAVTHPRTQIEEFERLKRRYTQTLEGDPKKHVVTQLFPGANPSLPDTFEEIGLKAKESATVA